VNLIEIYPLLTDTCLVAGESSWHRLKGNFDAVNGYSDLMEKDLLIGIITSVDQGSAMIALLAGGQISVDFESVN
jgi:hypothetical protein